MRELLPVALAFVSALFIYLGSPGQQWFARPLPSRFSRLAASLVVVAAILPGALEHHLATTLSIVITTLMTCFVAFPFVAVLRKYAVKTPR